tara:strand:+ start:198 stop:404 length:207 start_codon:yes stop_codon:yes gene_type:complete
VKDGEGLDGEGDGEVDGEGDGGGKGDGGGMGEREGEGGNAQCFGQLLNMSEQQEGRGQYKSLLPIKLT